MKAFHVAGWWTAGILVAAYCGAEFAGSAHEDQAVTALAVRPIDFGAPGTDWDARPALPPIDFGNGKDWDARR